MSEPGASTSQNEASSDIDVEAATLLSQGRRNLLVGDPPSAVQCLQEACELLSTKYGELALECGECYFYHGWALLELARMETGVLGNALDGVPEDQNTDEENEAGTAENPDKIEDEAERDKIFTEVQEALKDEKEDAVETASSQEDAKTESEREELPSASDGEKAGKEKPHPKEEEVEKEGENKEKNKVPEADEEKTEADKQEKKDEKAPEEQPMEAEEAVKKDEAQQNKDKKEDGKKDGKDEGAETSEDKAPEGDEAGDGEPDEAEDDDNDEAEDGAKAAGNEEIVEELTNFQLSWENLEVARVIFSKQEGDDYKLKVAQVYLKLGELGLETGNYAQSVEDFSQCLIRQKGLLANDSRLLAETHYNLALAYSFDLKFDKAIENFEESVVIIQNRRATLLKNIEAGNYTSDADLKQDQKEVMELEALIPEIKAKIDDAKSEKTTNAQAIRAAAQIGLGSSSSSSCFQSSSSGAPAQTIAVRKPTDPKSADTKPDDISHLMHRKRKPEDEAAPEATGKKLRQEEGAGDAATTNAVNGTNGVEQTTVNGDAKESPEKPEIQVKQIEQKTNGSTETAAMET